MAAEHREQARSSASSTRSSSRRCCCWSSSPSSRSSTCSPSRSPSPAGCGHERAHHHAQRLLARRLEAADLQHPAVQRGCFNSRLHHRRRDADQTSPCTALMAWGLSRRGLPGRRMLFVLVLVTIVFEPGIIPDYFVNKRLGLLDTYWSVILYKAGQRLVPDHPHPLLRGNSGGADRGGRARRRQPVPGVLARGAAAGQAGACHHHAVLLRLPLERILPRR